MRPAGWALPFVAAMVAGFAAEPDHGSVRVLSASFYNDLVDGTGVPSSLETSRIKYRVEQSCYRWVLNVPAEPRRLTVTETLRLPRAASNWDGAELSSTEVSFDRATGTTTLSEDLSDGEITNSWCIAEGDPAGPHRIDVHVGKTLLHSFRFELVPLLV